MMQQLLVHFQRCRAFPWNCDVVPTLSAKLLSFFQDVQKNVCLKLEVAAMVDWGQHFTYTLESDGPLGLNCFEIINTVRSAIHAAYCPIVQAVARKLEGKIHGVCQPQLFRYAQGCNQPGLDHFQEKVHTTLKDALAVFIAACLFLQPTSSDIDCAVCFSFKAYQAIKGRAPSLSKCADTDQDFCPLK